MKTKLIKIFLWGPAVTLFPSVTAFLSVSLFPSVPFSFSLFFCGCCTTIYTPLDTTNNGFCDWTFLASLFYHCRVY